MPQKIQFHWSEEVRDAGRDALHLCLDPLAEPPCTWFEDYCDYKGDFIEIYQAAKKKSTTWSESCAFQSIDVLDVPVLDAFEHHIHSFWMQVERDHRLIHNLINREAPCEFILNGSMVNSERIISCLFDPGLFEYTLQNIASRAGIPFKTLNSQPQRVESAAPFSGNKAGWLKKMAGGFSGTVTCNGPGA